MSDDKFRWSRKCLNWTDFFRLPAWRLPLTPTLGRSRRLHHPRHPADDCIWTSRHGPGEWNTSKNMPPLFINNTPVTHTVYIFVPDFSFVVLYWVRWIARCWHFYFGVPLTFPNEAANGLRILQQMVPKQSKAKPCDVFCSTEGEHNQTMEHACAGHTSAFSFANFSSTIPNGHSKSPKHGYLENHLA